MLLVVGGNGTVHEVINGMMARKDKVKLPIGIVPTGKSNDTAMSLGIENLD